MGEAGARGLTWGPPLEPRGSAVTIRRMTATGARRPTHGTGLRGIADGVEALGDGLETRSARGSGTTILSTISLEGTR